MHSSILTIPLDPYVHPSALNLIGQDSMSWSCGLTLAMLAPILPMLSYAPIHSPILPLLSWLLGTWFARIESHVPHHQVRWPLGVLLLDVVVPFPKYRLHRLADAGAGTLS